MMYKWLFIVFLILLPMGAPGVAATADADMVALKDRCDNISRLRAFEALYQRRLQAGDIESLSSNGVNRLLAILSELSMFEENTVLPFRDSATIAKRIEGLSRALETSDVDEKSQSLRFNIAYEYFLFYLAFLHEKYALDFHKEQSTIKEIAVQQLISPKELSQYLLQAQLYLQTLTRFEEVEEKETSPQLRDPLADQDAGSISYVVRNDNKRYLNAGFLALMIECEKLAGTFMLETADDLDDAFGVGGASEAVIRYYDRKTWNWLNELWKRYHIGANASLSMGYLRGYRDGSAREGYASYAPSAKNLYALYRTYLSYHFLWRYILDPDTESPFYNSLTRVLFERLNQLQKDAGLYQTVIYGHYAVETARDGSNTNFLPAVFFARRGPFMARHLSQLIKPDELFALYGEFYQDGAAGIRNNIPYRSRIYNELVLFGLLLNDLHLMEDTLYGYAMRATRIAGNETYVGTEFARSSRLTTAYLLASILDTKNRSGLYDGFWRYRDMADALCSRLIAKSNDNWRFAAVIHKSLAMLYSRKLPAFDESLAMYHAKQAFLTPCEKVALTYGEENWQQFFALPEKELAISCLKLFLYFHNKYPTNPEAVIPSRFNAHRVADKWIAERKSATLSYKGDSRP
ncbi:MAG: hypothetical protein SWH61_16500 [Thermodesulfobacteriota bacterium]|nr:hypothetical protein [Thermodesulfobacteriota bacterium]